MREHVQMGGMRIFQGFDEAAAAKIAAPVVTVGSYDGVHTGHRKILDRLTEIARKTQGESVVVTFDPHPRQVIFPDERMEILTTLAEKYELLADAGLQNLIVVNFDRHFRNLSSEEFAVHYLLEKLRAKVLVVGFNHHFGHDRQGNFDYLQRLQKQGNFALEQIPEVDVEQEKVSSTVIRKLLHAGNVEQAARCLQSNYRLSGRLDRGFFYTNNPDKLIPAPGEYQIQLSNGELTQLSIQSDKQLIISESQLNASNLSFEFISRIK